MTTIDLLLLCASYLAGSLPIGLWIGRLRGVDLREHGSRNIGATNAGRVLGRRFFFLVFALDFAKGCLPVVVAQRVGSGALAADTFGLLAGVAAIVGHVFPLFLRFKGGKGVATAAGVFAAAAPWPALIALLAWLALFLPTRYVSLASLGAAVVLPASCFLLPRHAGVAVGVPVQVAACAVGVLIVVRHRSNIGRLLRGEESRAGRPKS
ncbi:MAG: glycerol-3-phosphate 1-O-acyltransferase PlsY [Planctomycetes bacterium]|nr:glycerol-3-phosphate 1-O-acyltransferase PlsY [Planctomycetota bacterium]